MDCDLHLHARLREVGRLASLYYWLAEFLLAKRTEARFTDQIADSLEAASLEKSAQLSAAKEKLWSSLRPLIRLQDAPELQRSKVLTRGSGVARDCTVLFQDGLVRIHQLLERSQAPPAPPYVVRSRWLTELAAACLHPSFSTSQETEHGIPSSQEQAVCKILLQALSYAKDLRDTIGPIERVSALGMIGTLRIEISAVAVRAKAQAGIPELVLEVLTTTERCLDERIVSLDAPVTL